MAESGSVVSTAMKNAQCARRDGSVISCGLGINEIITVTSHDFIAKLRNVCVMRIIRRKGIGVKVGAVNADDAQSIVSANGGSCVAMSQCL
jgi:hypothetical protein